MAISNLPVAGISFEEQEKLKTTEASLASALDGFIAQRLVQAPLSREILLHEIVSIVQEQSPSRGAISLRSSPTNPPPTRH